METRLINDTQKCVNCGETFLAEFNYHHGDRCDTCVEHEIDRFYNEPIDDSYDDEWDHSDPIGLDRPSQCIECQKWFNIDEMGGWSEDYESNVCVFCAEKYLEANNEI